MILNSYLQTCTLRAPIQMSRCSTRSIFGGKDDQRAMGEGSEAGRNTTCKCSEAHVGQYELRNFQHKHSSCLQVSRRLPCQRMAKQVGGHHTRALFNIMPSSSYVPGCSMLSGWHLRDVPAPKDHSDTDGNFQLKHVSSVPGQSSCQDLHKIEGFTQRFLQSAPVHHS